MPHKTRRNHKKNYHKFAKKGTDPKCRLKTCRVKKYQSVYGGTNLTNTRSLISSFY